VEAGASAAVGARWFRHSGGMAPFELCPLSGRYLSFEEREEIALRPKLGKFAANERSLSRVRQPPRDAMPPAQPRCGGWASR